MTKVALVTGVASGIGAATAILFAEREWCVIGIDRVRSERASKWSTKRTILREADYISLNCTLNPTSYHVINHDALALMKPTAVLINRARGPLVDGAALVQALKEGRIPGAALDVFEVEPLPSDSPLRSLDNVMIAPHNANSSPTAWERVHRSTINNLLAVLKAKAK